MPLTNPQVFSAGGGSSVFQTLSFSNANGVSFSNNAGQVAGSVATTYRASNDAVGLNTAQSNVTWTVNSAGLSLDARGYAGTGTSATNASITLNSNGLAISVAAPGGGGAVNFSAGTTSNNLQSVVFSNANGLSFQLDGSTITASHNALTSQSNQAWSGSNASSTFQTLSFNNANGASWSNNAGAVEISYTRPVVSNAIQSVGSATGSGTNTSRFAADDHVHAGVFSMGVSNVGNTSGDTRVDVGRFVLAGGNNITLSQATAANGLNTITISAGAGGGGVAIGNSETTYTSGTVDLRTGGGAITIASNAGQQFRFSVPQTSSLSATGLASISTNGSTISIGVNPITMTASATGNTTQSSTGTLAISSMIFRGSNAVSVGVSNGSIIIDAPNAGAGNVTFSAGTSSGGFASLVFSNSNNVSFGLNGSTITASIPASSINNWELFPAGNNTTFSSLGQNSVYLQKMIPNAHYAFSNVELRMSGSFVSSNNSQVVAYTIDYGLYSLNANTYSSVGTSRMVISASYSSNLTMGYTISQGAASFTTSSNGTVIASLMSGFKHLYLPFTSTLTSGVKYAFGILISSATTVNTSPLRIALLNETIFNNLTIGKVHATTILASNASYVGDFNQAVGSVTTGAMPSSIAETALTNAVSQARLYLQLD